MRLTEMTGTTLTLYHGSNHEFNSFDLTKVGSSGSNQEGIGIYLSTDPEDSKTYGPYLYEVTVVVDKSHFLPEQKPFNAALVRSLITKSPDLEERLEDWGEKPDRALDAAVKTFTASYGPSDFRKLVVAIYNDFFDGGESAWLQLIANMGYAITEFGRSGSTKHYILYDLSVVKSFKKISP